eukprot:TRINITY_DN13511_c0_g1_i2.p1 TRINITY_DN13511_c0_g1~~TRINITY_DN13511_c0_g1_i2.p1  ORF type:complete len:191 (+),score=55.23 TRINITY_DN13511_c0_g1_i2:76-573(+)
MRLFLALLIVAVVFACDPPDCKREDCGSCGNACCMVNYEIDLPAKSLKMKLEDLLRSGGPDHLYSLQVPAGSSVPEFCDIKQYNKGGDYMGQAIHTTRVYRFNDTVNFFLTAKSETQTVLKVFSLSQIAGALCDEGQNYKNIIGVVKALGNPYKETTLLGCPVPN